jgi:hypothetical protein
MGGAGLEARNTIQNRSVAHGPERLAARVATIAPRAICVPKPIPRAAAGAALDAAAGQCDPRQLQPRALTSSM